MPHPVIEMIRGTLLKTSILFRHGEYLLEWQFLTLDTWFWYFLKLLFHHSVVIYDAWHSTRWLAGRCPCGSVYISPSLSTLTHNPSLLMYLKREKKEKKAFMFV